MEIDALSFRKNRLKEKLLAGEPAFGVSVMFPSPQIVEMVGKLSRADS